MSTDNDSFLEELFQEVLQRADSGGDLLEDSFFDVFTEYLVEAGEFETADRAALSGVRGIKVDGYGGDPLSNGDVLTLLALDFDPSESVSTLTATELDAIIRRVTNFAAKSLDGAWRDSLEVTSPAYGLSDLIATRWGDHIKRIRLIVLSNRVLSSRVDGVAAGAVEGVPVTHSVWDLDRLRDFVLAGREREELEVDLEEDFGGSLPALPAHLEHAHYQAFLVVLPGEQLARIYDRWGTRLLEQNVRVFLQAANRVNKGIKITIDDDPEMFFAYNNGITATAEKVDVTPDKEGLRIRRIRNLQIVNGGQTTASIHAALLRKADLSRVFVQMKLSIIEPELITEVVPRISKFANSQNTVSQSDFFSNHPFHVRMETFSRRVYAPSPDGSFKRSKWFYERARGQYRDARAGLKGRTRTEFDAEYPRSQLFTKTDLAKFSMVWLEKPDKVSKGAQASFLAFADLVAGQWEKNANVFNETYFAESIAKAIVFRRLERLVQEQSWYDGGYRANVVAYAISKLAFAVRESGNEVDFDQIWRAQSLSEEMEEVLLASAVAAHDVLIRPAAGRSNVTEWAKQPACWHRVQQVEVAWPDGWSKILRSKSAAKQSRREGLKDQKLLNGIEAQMAVLNAPQGFWTDVRTWGTEHKVISAKESSILRICESARMKLPSEFQCAAALKALKRLQGEGMPLELPTI